MGSYFSKKPIKTLLVGLDAAGKTTILYKIQPKQYNCIYPSIGFPLEQAQHHEFNIFSFDLGGYDRGHKLLRRGYFENVEAIVYVIDSLDKERFDSAQSELEQLLSEEKLKGLPLLVFANKQDIATIAKQKLAEEMNLQSIKGRQWNIIGTCALKGQGIQEGFEWLRKTIEKR